MQGSPTPRPVNWQLYFRIVLPGFLVSLAIIFGARSAGASRPLSSGLGAFVMYSCLFAAMPRATGVPLTRKFLTVVIPIVLLMAFVQGALMTLAD